MKFKLVSLGCKVNSYECASMRALLLSMGYIEARKGEEVDVAIINTCSVTATADQKSRQQIRKLKNKYPNAVIAVMGCYSQGNHKFIENEIKPNIIVGASNRDKIPELIQKCLQSHSIYNLTDENTREFKYEELGPTNFGENVRAYLKIQDGCNNFCSYCIIPYRRGVSRSRDKLEILAEANRLVKSGYKEIVLTGIHVGGYGLDLSNYKFSNLVEDLSNIDGLYRLRISSIEESEIDDKLINLIKTKDNIAKHLHIPLQSGSKTVLKRMNRKYDSDEFLNKIIKIKKEIPDIALTTDVIVGFPGESRDEFYETYEFINKCGFHMLHVFPFSAREGTAAYLMPNQIDPQTKSERSHILLDLSKKLWDEYCNRFVNTESEVLFEEFNKETSENIGHTPNYLHISIKNKDNLVGKIEKINIKKTDII